MRILYIAPDLSDSGGISRVISLKANYFADTLCYDVHILSPKITHALPFYAFDPKIQWHNIIRDSGSNRFLYDYIRFVRSTLEQVKPDVIIYCDSTVHWMFVQLFVGAQIPVIMEVHTSVHLRLVRYKGLFGRARSWLIQLVKERLQRKFSKVVFISKQCRSEWKLPNSTVIPNPLSFSVATRAELANKRAIAVSRHSYEKGIDRLLLIWKRVTEQHPDWQLDIFGQWGADLTYQKMAAELKLSDKVNFVAPVSDIKDHYLNSSLYLMCSRSEAFGMVLLEAMACGLPCVAYDCPSGPGSIIVSDENGYLIKDGDEEAFVNAVLRLIENENLRMELGSKATQSSKKYDIDDVMSRWVALLGQVVHP